MLQTGIEVSKMSNVPFYHETWNPHEEFPGESEQDIWERQMQEAAEKRAEEEYYREQERLYEEYIQQQVEEENKYWREINEKTKRNDA